MATGRIGTTPALGFRWSESPSGGTTSLSGLDDNSVGLSYTPGNERVYRNGVLLSRGSDYTATDGTTITLQDATITGDIIEVFSQDLAQLTDAISKSSLTAKGTLLSASAASTLAVLGVGANDTVLTADSAETTGLKWAAPAAGINPNIIINGNFTINQRAYVSGATLASGNYGFDRWKSNAAGTTLTFTSAPYGQTITINSTGGITQIIEQANVGAGTYVLSWSGTATARIYNVGATPPSYAASPVSFTADGLANVQVDFTADGGTRTCGLIKLEIGSTPSTFIFAGNTLEGELANCLRYFWQIPLKTSFAGMARSTVQGRMTMDYPVPMRVAPTGTISATGWLIIHQGTGTATTSAALSQPGIYKSQFIPEISSAPLIQGDGLIVQTADALSSLSAEF